MINIPFIKYSKLWLTITSVVTLACIALLVVWGLKPGIDFTGGSLLEVSFSKQVPNIDEVRTSLVGWDHKNAVAQTTGENGIIIRTSFLGEDDHIKLVENLETKFSDQENVLQEKRFETIGSSVSQTLRQRAIIAIILVNFAIIAYIAYAFRHVSRPVASWKYGVIAFVALVHDVLLVMGVFSVLGRYIGVEVDIAFVVALLTILGCSVNDKIVVFDRVRENLLRHRSESFSDTVNAGLNQTLMRSINLTIITLIPLLVLYFVGGATIKYFSLALIIGVASGAYSSIFIASPLLAVVERWQVRRLAKV